jgi:hypothetical protein
MLEMFADRGRSDSEDHADFGVGFSAAEPEQYFVLTLRETMTSRASFPSGGFG